MSLSCERKPEYPGKAHTNTKRKSKARTERLYVQPGELTQNLLTVRHQS